MAGEICVSDPVWRCSGYGRNAAVGASFDRTHSCAMDSTLLKVTLLMVCGLVLALLLSRRMRESKRWRALVTPLASIIGSGFLVIVPLLGHIVGAMAPVAIAGVVLLAYWVGHAIDTRLLRLEQVSDLALAISYFVSVTFYLRLLSSFVLRGVVGTEDELVARVLTTVIIALITGFGWFRGLSLLERMEEYSVSIKLSIIAALIVGLGVYDVTNMDLFETVTRPDVDTIEVIRTLAGVLIVVQGFETSRYLGEEYDAKTRIQTMRWAQLIAAGIYVVFVLLSVPTFQYLPDQIDETAIIDISGRISIVMPVMLVIAAVMSQFSAAVADTIGAGGLLSEGLRRWRPIKPRVGYLCVGVVAIGIVWVADVFEIISLASRAFAFYYAAQSTLAAIGAYKQGRLVLTTWFGLLALVLALICVIAIPAG